MDHDDEITPVDRLPVNPTNKAPLMVLHNLTLAMRGRVDRLAEIAHGIAVDPAPIHQITLNRIADVLHEDGQDEIKAAASLRT